MTRCLIAFVFAAALLPTSTLEAQWRDAQLPRRGELQIGLSGENLTFDHLFVDGDVQPLRRVLSTELDARLIPELDSLNDSLAQLYWNLGLPLPEPSHLGNLQYDALFERTNAPISLSFGATEWLAAFVVVPVVKSETSAAAKLDSLPSVTGYTPDQLASFLPGLGNGIARLESMVAADTLPADLQTEAERLLADARTLEAGLTGISAGLFAPTSTGAPGRNLLQYYGQMQSDFGAFEISVPELTLASNLTEQNAVDEVRWQELGIEPPQYSSTGIKLGDIEAGLSVQAYNSFRERPDRPRPRFPIRVRIDGLYRFATGSPPAAGRLTDAGTGDGQPDIELRSTLDIGLSRRFWLSAYAGLNIQLAGEVERLVTSRQQPIQVGSYTMVVRWDPGDVLTLVAAPRFNFTQTITFSGLIVRTRHGKDSVQPVDPVDDDAAFVPADLEEGTQFTATSIGFAARFSTTHWAGERRSGIPVEVELRYLRTTSAKNGLVPRHNSWQVGLRYYQSIFK
jgi:hypothetical protein